MWDVPWPSSRNDEEKHDSAVFMAMLVVFNSWRPKKIGGDRILILLIILLSILVVHYTSNTISSW